jgi:hypothetical protein
MRGVILPELKYQICSLKAAWTTIPYLILQEVLESRRQVAGKFLPREDLGALE